jgi:tetratricopeptide (TPR) repeat protein
VVFASVALGTLHLRRGDFDRAVEVLERARALARTADALAASAQTASPLAAAYARSGRTAEARTVLESALEQALAMGDPFGHWLRTGGMAEVRLREGDAAEALALARRAVDVTRFVKARGMQAWASWLVGEAAARLGDAGAATAYREALERAESTGMRPLAAHCRLGLGLLALAGRLDADGRAEVAAALEAFAAMGMRSWAEVAQRVLDGQP